MTDMPKQQYLSRDDKGWKLRRRVPDKLQKLVGKTQWIERLARAEYGQACERAKTFGVRTDAEIKQYEGQLKNVLAANSKRHLLNPGSILS